MARKANAMSKIKRGWESNYGFGKRKRAAKHVTKQTLREIARKERAEQRAFEEAAYEYHVFAREVADMENFFLDYDDSQGWE